MPIGCYAQPLIFCCGVGHMAPCGIRHCALPRWQGWQPRAGLQAARAGLQAARGLAGLAGLAGLWQAGRRTGRGSKGLPPLGTLALGLVAGCIQPVVERFKFSAFLVQHGVPLQQRWRFLVLLANVG